MKQFYRSDTLVKKSLLISYIVLGLLILAGLFSHLNSYTSRSSAEDLFDKRFKIYQATATVIKNVSDIHLNLDKATRRAIAGFDQKEVNLLVREQLAAFDETNEVIKEALLSEWVTPAEKTLCEVVLNNLRNYKESCVSTFGVGTPNLRMASLSVGIYKDRFTELNRSLHDLLNLEDKLSQESSNRRPRSLSVALGNLYPTFESSYPYVHEGQPISRQALNRTRE